MGAQIPAGAAAAAGAILAFSFICLGTSLLLILLVWVQSERKSYVALLGYILSLSVAASIIQQIHTIARWNDIKTAQWENVKKNVGDPELNITGASTGLDLVVFYVQYYTYNAESMLILFWATELAWSIFQIRSTRANRLHGSLIAKGLALILPAVQQVLLRQPAFHKSTTGYMVLASFIMITCFGLGAMLLLAILVKYIHARIALVTWKVPYGLPSGGTNDHSAARLYPNSPQAPKQPKKSIYDRWLLLRFTIGFVALGLFELVIINFQLRAAAVNTEANIPPFADLSAERAISDFILFVPGVSGAPLVFLVFGTTRTFRDYMARIFLTQGVRDKLETRRQRKRKPSAVVSIPAGIMMGNNLSPRDLEAGNGVGGMGAVRMQDFARSNSERGHPEWPLAGGRRQPDSDDDHDELPIMKPLPGLPKDKP